MKIDNIKIYAPAIVRIALACVFLWFGFSQLRAPSEWIGFLPEFILDMPFSPAYFILTNALIEVIFGFFLLAGILTRFSALILGLHLIGIAFSLGYGALAVRDLGLAIATLSVFINGNDILCYSRKEKTSYY